jgi:hypothetical protein
MNSIGPRSFRGSLLLLALTLVMAPSQQVWGDDAPQLRVVNHTRAGLGDELVVEIKPWDDLKADPKDWVPYFNGVPVKGIHPENADFRDGTLRYYLHRDTSDPKSKEVWSILHRGFAFYQPVSVGIGPETGADTRILPQPDFELIVVPQRAFFLYILVFAALLVLFIMLARRSSMLRDSDTIGTAGLAPYSLGRSQMAFWFFLILAAYGYIGLVNWDYLNTIPASALGLMGISAATALGAVLIDSSKVDQATSLQAEQAALQSRTGQLPGLIATAAPAIQPALTDELMAKRTRLAEVNPLVAALSSRAYGTEAFVKDLISDANGVSLHRFQIFVWTLVLGTVFAVSVVRDLAMPEFGATLLALMGISSGTYLGFKFPEKKN